MHEEITTPINVPLSIVVALVGIALLWHAVRKSRRNNPTNDKETK